MNIKNFFNFLKTSEFYLFLFCFFIYAFFYAVFFPGGMGSDSINQWREIQTMELSDWHPYTHTLINKFFSLFWNNAGVITLMQIVFFIFAIIWSYIKLSKLGISKKILFPIFALFSILPANIFLVLTQWKDIPYSICFIFITTYIYELVLSKGSCFEKKQFIIPFTISLILPLLFRHNGIITVISILIFILIFYFKNYKNILLIIGSVFLAYVFISYIFPIPLNVSKTSKTEAYSIPLQQIAAILKENVKITADEEKYINSLAPINDWKTKYDPYLSDPVKNIVRENLDNNSSGFYKVYFGLVSKYPKIALTAFLNQTALAWSPFIFFQENTALTNWISQNEFGINQIFENSNIWQKTTDYFFATVHLRNLFYNPALYLYISIAFIIIISIKTKEKEFLLILLPTLTNTLGLLLLMPSQDFRYFYPNLFGMLICLCVFIKHITKKIPLIN